MKEKAKYKTNIYYIDNDGYVIKKVELNEERPHINDYVNYFAPKLSTCYSIQMFELQQTNHYKLIESWFKGKRGWKQVI